MPPKSSKKQSPSTKKDTIKKNTTRKAKSGKYENKTTTELRNMLFEAISEHDTPTIKALTKMNVQLPNNGGLYLAVQYNSLPLVKFFISAGEKATEQNMNEWLNTFFSDKYFQTAEKLKIIELLLSEFQIDIEKSSKLLKVTYPETKAVIKIIKRLLELGVRPNIDAELVACRSRNYEISKLFSDYTKISSPEISI